MQHLPARSRLGWPNAPKNAAGWIALPEISFGRYLLADVGWVSSGRENAVAAGVAGLPMPRDAIDNGFVALPAVTVVGPDGALRMFRLPLPYAAAVRRFALGSDRPRHERDFPGHCSTVLPCHFVIGDLETIHLVPDDQAKQAGRLN